MILHLYSNCLFAIKTGSTSIAVNLFLLVIGFTRLLSFSSSPSCINESGMNASPWCKAKLSRIVAFTLLVELCRDCTPNLVQVCATHNFFEPVLFVYLPLSLCCFFCL